MEHIEVYRVERFNKFFNSPQNRERIVKDIVSQFKKSFLDEHKMHCNDKVVSALLEVLDNISTFDLLNFKPTAENVENRIIDMLNNKLIAKLSSESKAFAAMAAENPSLSEDNYWDDWCSFWQILALAVGGDVDVFGDGQYTFAQRFCANEEILEDTIRNAMPCFFGRLYEIDGKRTYLTEMQLLERVKELNADGESHNIIIVR